MTESEGGEAAAVGCFDPGETIAGLRGQGAQALDPVRFRFIEALARRASAHEGDARRLLDDKLAGLLRAYEEQFDKARSEAGYLLDGMAGRFPQAAAELKQFHAAGDFRGLRRHTATLEDQSHRRPLADLVRLLAEQLPESGRGDSAHDTVADAGPSAELKTLRYFRSTWSQLSVDQRLNQSTAKVPENAGPLNSHGLALRSLKLMRELSPAYLNRFMSYLDALQWLDKATDGGAPVPKAVVRGDGDGKQKAGRRRSV